MSRSFSHAQLTAIIPSALQRPAETHGNNRLSVVDSVSLGFVLIIAILMSRQLVVILRKRYQLQRMVVLLQRKATLERLLNLKFVSKQASSKRPFRQPDSE